MKRLLVLLALGSGCTDHHLVDLDLGKTGPNDGIPIGFHCHETDPSKPNMIGDPLFARALTNRVLSVRVDLLAVPGGVPSCRAAELSEWCQQRHCRPLSDARYRRCLETRMPGTGTTELDALRKLLTEDTLIRDAPDDLAMVRVIATAQPCSEATLDRSKLIGCAFSCPTLFDAVKGKVLLDLPTLSKRCENQVCACASDDFNSCQ